MAVTWKQIAYQLDVSTADSKAVSAGGAGSSADSKAVSAGAVASVADSKAVSAGVLASTALSTANAMGSSAAVSTADSKAVSAGLAASTADSKAVSVGSAASVADSKAVSAGVLAGSHATRHKLGGADVILLNEFGLPTGAVAFNGQQVTDLVLHTVPTSSAITGVTPLIGKIVFATDSTSAWICTSAA